MLYDRKVSETLSGTGKTGWFDWKSNINSFCLFFVWSDYYKTAHYRNYQHIKIEQKFNVKNVFFLLLINIKEQNYSYSIWV